MLRAAGMQDLVSRVFRSKVRRRINVAETSSSCEVTEDAPLKGPKTVFLDRPSQGQPTIRPHQRPRRAPQYSPTKPLQGPSSAKGSFNSGFTKAVCNKEGFKNEAQRIIWRYRPPCCRPHAGSLDFILERLPNFLRTSTAHGPRLGCC